jgi:hypothetical protein
MGTLKLLLGVAIIATLIIVGVQVIPPYFNNYQFEDALNNEALAGTYSTKTEEELRAIVLKSAREMDIPLTAQDVKVARSGGMGTGTLVIEANYTVHVDLPFYPLDLNFHAASKNKGIY